MSFGRVLHYYGDENDQETVKNVCIEMNGKSCPALCGAMQRFKLKTPIFANVFTYIASFIQRKCKTKC